MSAAHTPGPWAIKGRVHSSNECVRIESRHPGQDNLGYQVADVLDANGYPQNAANARLIAAAPDLLEVANLALRMGQYGGVSPSTVEDAARAAIAKATGEQL